MRAIAAHPSPTRGEARRRALVLVVLATLAALGVFVAVGGVARAGARPPSIAIALTGGWAIAAAVLTRIVTARRTSLGPDRGLLVAVTALTPVLLFTWMRLFAGAYVPLFPPAGMRCLALMLAIGALPLATFLAIRRGAEPRAPALLGAAGGAISGAWAALLVDLWCPVVEAPHALIGHVLAVVVLAAAGAIAGRRMLATV